jgi:hypothetical protein
MPQPAKSGRIDWASERDRIDLAMVVTRHLGPATGRKGGGRLWWCCPFHQDRNPSFQVKGRHWKCFGCGTEGDAIEFVRRMDGSLSFPDAVRLLVGGSPVTIRPSPSPEPDESRADAPGPDWQARALGIIEQAEARLWNEQGGGSALAYLNGRGLTEATIRAARMGLSNGRTRGVAAGITIPWFDHGTPRMIQVRQPDGCEPKYKATWGSRRGGLYPDPAVVRPGRPVVIVEGEFDALLLGQELGELATVVTLGSASERPKPAALGVLLGAYPWYVATDADAAGDRAATVWPTHARRVRPPCGAKDWTDAARRGANLRQWWGELLAGVANPRPFDWQTLSALRWGEDPSPGLNARPPTDDFES